MRQETLLFDEPGPQNTEALLEAVARRAKELDVRTVVLATSTGSTALEAADALSGLPVQIVAVTLHAGYWDLYAAPDEQKVAAAEAKGVRFLTCTHSLMGNVEGAVREKFGGIPPVELIAHTYYTFSQGMKVAVEVTVSAADAGLVQNGEEVIAVGGTSTGADTAAVVRAAYSTNFFDLRVREVIAMPR
jgi:hypothetical protein